MVNNYQCNEEYNISFIPQDVFEKHVENTINAYKETLNKIDLKKKPWFAQVTWQMVSCGIIVLDQQ